jgi:hypothetical protein
MNAIRISLTALAFAATLLLGVRVPQDASGPTPAQRFSAELTACETAAAAGNPGKCRLFGKIQYVDAFPDVKVHVVDAFPDVRVQVVDALPDGPGKWQVVDAFPDFKVQKVSAFPDYKIQFVSAFPGCD